MTARTFAVCTGVFLLGCVVLAGCGKGGSGSGTSGFSSAAPEIKEAWEKAVVADKANDYVPAVLAIVRTAGRVSGGLVV
jgi:hypothetical protein